MDFNGRWILSLDSLCWATTGSHQWGQATHNRCWISPCLMRISLCGFDLLKHQAWKLKFFTSSHRLPYKDTYIVRRCDYSSQFSSSYPTADKAARSFNDNPVKNSNFFILFALTSTMSLEEQLLTISQWLERADIIDNCF